MELDKEKIHFQIKKKKRKKEKREKNKTLFSAKRTPRIEVSTNLIEGRVSLSVRVSEIVNRGRSGEHVHVHTHKHTHEHVGEMLKRERERETEALVRDRDMFVSLRNTSHPIDTSVIY